MLTYSQKLEKKLSILELVNHGISDKHAAALIAILNNSSITVYASFTGNRYWILGRNKAYEICRHMGLEYKMNEANTEMVFR